MEINAHVTPRSDTPRWLQLSLPVLTTLAAFLTGAIILVISGFEPLEVYRSLLLDPLVSEYRQGQILTKSVPLVLAGLGVYIPLKAGLWNIGAEGQIFIGGTVAAAIALFIAPNSPFLMPLVIVGGALAGAVWGLIPGILLARWDVNEIITTLMMVFIAVQINTYMINSVLPGPSGQPYTELFPQAGQIPPIGHLSFLDAAHWGIAFVPLAVVVVYVIMKRSPLGFEIEVAGLNPTAADQSGMNRTKLILFTMGVGGLLAGLGGMGLAAGEHGRLVENLSPGYGYTAIPIALIGRRSAFHVLLAGLFFSLLVVGGNAVSVSTDVPKSIISIIEALVFLFLITGEFFKHYEFSIDIQRDTTAAGGV